MASLLTDDRFAGQADGTVVATGTLTNWDAASGTGTLTQHHTGFIRPGITCIASIGETASKYAVSQDGSGTARGVSFVGMMTDVPAVSAYIAQLRATTTGTACELQLSTTGGLRMRNVNTGVGSTIQLPVGPHRVDWFVDSVGLTQTLTIYDWANIDSTDTNRSVGTTSGSYTTGTVDYTRIGNIAATAGGMWYAWTAVNIDDAALPAPTLLRVKPSSRRSMATLGV